MWAHADVTRYIGGRPFTEEETWARFLRYAGHWDVLGFGYWAVEERASGEFVGEVGFADYRRDIEPPIHDTPELGWVLLPEFHGRGYATEAVRAAIEWGGSHLANPSTVCLIHPENRASIRVADKCGFRQFCLTTYHGQPAALYRRIASR
jgi:RimJ/RimL family protein N-acetyltransferase